MCGFPSDSDSGSLQYKKKKKNSSLTQDTGLRGLWLSNVHKTPTSLYRAIKKNPENLIITHARHNTDQGMQSWN